MLDGLYTIPWHALGHAYGEASEVPGLIRDLASPKKSIRRAAYSRLGCTVYHQGTVYSSTAYIVPFFLELLEAKQVKDKTWLLNFLFDIAHGSSYIDVHYREEEERSAPEIQRKLAEELSWVKAAKDAVSASYPTYLRLLAMKHARRSAYAAWILAYCSDYAEQVIPAMQECLLHEERQLVRASIILSLGQLMSSTEETHAYFTQLLGEQTVPLVKIAAAMGYAFCAKEATPEEVVQVLLEGYEQPRLIRDKFSRLPFARVDMDASISKALRAIGFSIAQRVVPTLTRVLKRSDLWSGLVLVDNLLYLALEGKIISKEMTVNDLTTMQREALGALVASKNVWGLGNMEFTVGDFFAPKYDMNVSIWSRKDVAKFLDND